MKGEGFLAILAGGKMITSVDFVGCSSGSGPEKEVMSAEDRRILDLSPVTSSVTKEKSFWGYIFNFIAV